MNRSKFLVSCAVFNILYFLHFFLRRLMIKFRIYFCFRGLRLQIVHSCPIPVVVHPVWKTAKCKPFSMLFNCPYHRTHEVNIEVFVKLFITMCSDAQVRYMISAHLTSDSDLVHLDHAGIVVVEDCRLHCLTIDWAQPARFQEAFKTKTLIFMHN